jgi:hypothetical protein
VYLFERVMPDPFILAIALSVLTALLAALLAPKGTPALILSSWYGGIFSIAGFAFQMILVLVTGQLSSRHVVLRVTATRSFTSPLRKDDDSILRAGARLGRLRPDSWHSQSRLSGVARRILANFRRILRRPSGPGRGIPANLAHVSPRLAAGAQNKEL